MTFSSHAEEKLRELYTTHDTEVGSELKKADPKTYASFTPTDCITYVMKVVSHAFEAMGNPAVAREVRRLSKYGTSLAKYLVTQQGWSGIYINPDRVHPIDIDQEHTFSDHRAAKSCLYYGIPLQYRVVNYNVTAPTHWAYRQLNKTAGATASNSIDIASLELLTFGFGLSRGGEHTWLFSRGKVYEVHWDRAGSDLYEETPLRSYEWLSGAIVIPPDQIPTFAVSAKLTCAGR